MLDLLLKNQSEFLKKFREYSKENFVFYEVVEGYIKEEGVTTTPLSDKISTTHIFDKTYAGNVFEVTFSDNLNFIMAKNKQIEDDNTCKSYILIDAEAGSTRMNCHITSYYQNSFPIDFTLEGIGSVEHFFQNKDSSKIHEIKFGTWRFPNEAEEFCGGRILNLFPAILREDEPSIEIRFSEGNENIAIQIQYDSGKFKEDEYGKDNFNIDIKIDKKRSDYLISTYRNPVELRSYMIANLKTATQTLVNDSISKWLSGEIDIKNILSKADSDEIKITYEILPYKSCDHTFSQEVMISELLSWAMHLKNFPLKTDIKESKIAPKPHPTEEELRKIEKCDEGESRSVSRPAYYEEKIPNQKTKNPQVRNINQETSWVRL